MNQEAEPRDQDDAPPIVMEDIKPTMTLVDRDRALAEIMRVLRGEE